MGCTKCGAQLVGERAAALAEAPDAEPAEVLVGALVEALVGVRGQALALVAHTLLG